MAAKPPAKKKRRRKMRLTLKQKKMDPSKDSYSDSLGWSTQVGTTLKDAPKPKAPEKLTIQCEMCGSMLQSSKPKNARYTIKCSYDMCGHENVFE